MNEIHLNRASVARSLTTSLGASKAIDSLACGLIQPGDYMPDTEGQYWVFRRYMHDILCLALIDNGTFKFREFNLNKAGIQTNEQRLNRQHPDLYTIEAEGIHIGEVTLTYNLEADVERKRTKYKDLCEFINKLGINVRLDIIALDLTNPEWSDSFSSLSKMFLDMLNDFITCLRAIHSNPKFGNIRKVELGKYNTSRMQYVLEEETVVSQVFQATGVMMEYQEIEHRMDGLGKDKMTDESYISQLATSIIHSKTHKRPTPDPRPVDPETMKKEFKKMFDKPPNTTKLPKILQLGCPAKFEQKKLTFDEVCVELRSTPCSGGYLDHVKQSLFNENPDIEDRIVYLHLSSDQLEKEQMEGPGRKALMKRNGLVPERKEPTHIGYLPQHETLLADFIHQLKSETIVSRLDDLRTPPVMSAGISLTSYLEHINLKLETNSISAMLLFYQDFSNEIVLNSMRRRKNGQYVLGYTGFSGVYFLVAPGPQLRTESNVEFIKVISTTSPLGSGFALDWVPTGDHWESHWFSVDVDRLKHWQRSFDRVSVSLLANAERLVRPGVNMKSALDEEMLSGNYALLALTYLENKQLTSVTNQTLRYLWMKSLGDKQFDGLASKFPSRVNSILQSVMLQRAMRSCEQLCKTKLTDLVKVTKLNRDDETGLYDETTTGVVNLLPRLFTYGQQVPISYNLNEIYWCMAYNKDRQNAVQDALHIMEKIVKEENKYDKEIGARQGAEKVNYFLGHTSLEEDIAHAHTETPESHFYSSRAVRVGLRLQDKHPENMADNGSWMNSEKLEKILSKPLSDYATFKASVKSIAEYVDPNDLNEAKKVGVRTKAIELVAEILEKEELMTAADVAMQYSGDANKTFEILIQIFKKGQIGGVREIIILFIKARVMMNIVEEVARLLCKSDKREILTKGRDKRLMMRGDHEEVTSSFPEGTPLQIVKESYDMTVWCQKFIPFIFSQIHRHHFQEHPGMHALATHIFLAHSNKKIEYPRKLVEQWIIHKDIKHSTEAMQKVKEKFLKDGKPFLINHSNMCQGIPHYNSSVLGLSCISLRDALFQECLRQMSLKQAIKWRTRLGSDDKGTIIAVDLSEKSSRYQLILFGQCERVAERLHCMELSIKSASGHVMYELNSAYMANLETMSPTIKFSLASTDTIETTSCTTFVNESYSRIRQMRENGCSSLICAYAHLRNAEHFDKIFGTGNNDVNDVSTVFKMPKVKIPYDFGVYPFYDADLQDIVGPEFYNYNIIRRFGTSNPAVKLLYTSLSSRDQEEMFKREDDDLLKKDHFGIQQGIVRQLAKMRERTNSKAEEVEEFFTKNPFLIVRGPETPQEALMVVRSKLFTKGAAQSLRRTSPAIYIGRLAAYRSARAWTMVKVNRAGLDIETMEDVMVVERSRLTYSEYLAEGLKKVEGTPDLDLDSLISVLFPNYRSLDIVRQLIGKFGATKSTEKKFSQAVRTWTVNNFNYEFTSSLKSILSTSFNTSDEASKEDVEEFKKLIGMSLGSLESFVEECKGRGIRPLDMFFYLAKLHKGSRTTRVQTFAYGPSTNSLHMTAVSLKRYNHMPGMVAILEDGFEEETLEWANTMASKVDKVKLYHNLILMRETGRFTNVGERDIRATVDGHDFDEMVRTIVRSTKSIAGFDFTTQKAMKLVAAFLLPEKEFRDKLIDWKDLNYTYLRKQSRHVANSGQVSWTGDLEVLVSAGNDCFTMVERQGKRFVTAKKINDTSQLYRSLVQMCKTLGMELHSFFKRRPMSVGDIYLSDSSKKLHISEANGVQGNVLSIRYNNKFCYKRVVDLLDFKIMKSFDVKTQTLTIHLEGKNGKTATVCHSRGSFYPVEIPTGIRFDNDLFYQGVRFNTIVKNKDWFFTRRLPSMTESENVRFLREDVDFKTIATLESDDITRINEYMEVREEVNEASFPVLHQFHEDPESGESFEFDDQTLFNKFESFMREEAQTGDMRNLTVNDWAAEVEAEMQGMLEFEKDEETVLITKAFGYKKPKQKKAAHTISSLMQGAEMRMRVMDQFFRFGSIKAEATRNLPGYAAYTLRMIQEGKLEEYLGEMVVSHIIKSLSENTGTKKSKLNNAIRSERGRILEVPLRPLHMLINRDDRIVTQEDFLEGLYRLSEDYQEVVSDNESAYSDE
uniref:RNA-directed RNA polymerase L n=1 Tax=Exserohilum turcicum mycobunyavirales-like virus 1 TaxID=3229031 RepID=A0AAU7YCI2_9VIRU